MSEFSIAETKAQLPRLVQQAEAGDVVRITRRGRQVAVLLSRASDERLIAPRDDLAGFLNTWRAAMDARGIAPPDAAAWQDLRDNSARPAPGWE